MTTDSLPTAVKCAADTAALVVIDLQQRLGDAMPGKVLNRVILNTCLLARTAGLLGLPVLQTEQHPRGLGATHPTVVQALPAATSAFTKMSFSCCDDPDFNAALASSGRRHVVLVGMEAHICVLQTALDLRLSGHQVFVVEDAICSRRLENYQNALDRLRQCGVQVVSAESVVFEWLRTAAHPQFKAIQALLR